MGSVNDPGPVFNSVFYNNKELPCCIKTLGQLSFSTVNASTKKTGCK